MTAHVTSADGTRIAHTVQGDGPAVVIVDGALCHRGSGPARGIAAQLADSHRVFGYDRRGRGESGTGGPYDVQREIEDLAALIEAAGGSATLLGISSGAALALRAAAAGIGVDRVVAYEPPFSTSDEQRKRFAEYRAGLAADLAAGDRGAAVARSMAFVGAPRLVVAHLRNSPTWPALEAVAPTLAHDADVLDGADGAPVPAQRLAALTVPVLLLDGGDSPAMLRDATREAAAATPTARYGTLPGQTHEVSPDVLAAAVVEFLAKA